jgi:hypothetical protein
MRQLFSTSNPDPFCPGSPASSCAAPALSRFVIGKKGSAIQILGDLNLHLHIICLNLSSAYMVARRDTRPPPGTAAHQPISTIWHEDPAQGPGSPQIVLTKIFKSKRVMAYICGFLESGRTCRVSQSQPTAGLLGWLGWYQHTIIHTRLLRHRP